MSSQFIANLDSDLLLSIKRGIEKESLRVDNKGNLSLNAHPIGLGSSLTHPNITTDFSEAQLELITHTHSTIESCLDELFKIHQYVYKNIGEELLWCSSMPCSLPTTGLIPLGNYGKSHVGLAKTVYRQGLAHRYGARMQMISGVHYNFSIGALGWEVLTKNSGNRESVKDFINHRYFSLIRNFQREAWLLLYLFGASPAVCNTFSCDRAQSLRELSPNNSYLPSATSLRMGPLGYQSDVQSSIAVSYNTLETYTQSLKKALTDPYPPYGLIGIRDENSYYQLSTSLLQIENEFYSTIRPKRRIRSGERALKALNSRGVEYIEIRALDLDPFSPIGISDQTIRFLDVFLLNCLLSESRADSPQEILSNHHNQHIVAEYGRDPDIRLSRKMQTLSVEAWGLEIVDRCMPIADALDNAFKNNKYSHAINHAKLVLKNPDKTLSGRVLSFIDQNSRHSFTQSTLESSKSHKDQISRSLFSLKEKKFYQSLARDSQKKQIAIEKETTGSFEKYRDSYINQDLL